MPSFKKYSGPEKKISEEVIKEICNNLLIGNYLETAAVMAGVRKQTFYNWIRLAHKKPKSIYGRLLDAVEEAQAKAIARDLINIDKCAMGQGTKFLKDENGKLVLNHHGDPIVETPGAKPDWQASAWRLERRNPKTWSRTEKIETTGKEGGPIELTSETAEDKKKRLEDKIAKLKLLAGK